MLIHMLLALLGDDHLHVEATMLEGEAVLRIVDTEPTADTLGRLVEKTAHYVLLLLDQLTGRNSIAGRLDACLGGVGTKFAMALSLTGTVKTARRLGVDLLQPLLLCIRVASELGGK